MHELIDSRKLQIFLCLANRGSLKAAAAELCLTSSAVSHAISTLEENLGVQLFHRSGKGLVLTDRGETLLRKAQPVVAQMNNLRSALTDEHMNGRGELKTASGCSFLSYVMPDVVREFSQTLPRVRLSVQAAERVRSLQMLRDREVDLAVLTDPPIEGTEFNYTRLFEDELLIAVPVGSSLAALERIPLRMLGGKTLLLGRNKSHTVRILQAQMRRKGLEFRDCVEVGNIASICELAKLDQGIALLPDWALRAERAGVTLVSRPIESVCLRRTWAVVSAQWSQVGLASRTFTRLCSLAGAEISRRHPVSVPKDPALVAAPEPLPEEFAAAR